MSRKSIVYIGLGTWGGSTSQNSVRIMSVLSRDYDILFVNYTYTWKDVIFRILGLNNFPIKYILGLKNRIEEKKTTQGYSLKTLTAYPIIPVNFIKYRPLFLQGLKLNNWILRRCISTYLKKLNYSKNATIIYGFNPFMGVFNIGKLNESQNIYYCYDQIKAAKWASKHGEFIENTFIKKVDHVITTSRALFDEKSILNKNCKLVQNGVDFELFSKAISNDTSKKNNPVVGYIGVVDFRVDFQLIEYLAREVPDYKFRFVGKIMEEEEVKKLERFDNIEFLGEVIYEEVIMYLEKMDICIIPFVHNEFTRNIYPIKINEYLAAGKPVVSTDFADLQEFKTTISVSHSNTQFMEFLKNEFLTNNPEKVKQRMGLAKSNSWEYRANSFKELIS